MNAKPTFIEFHPSLIYESKAGSANKPAINAKE